MTSDRPEPWPPTRGPAPRARAWSRSSRSTSCCSRGPCCGSSSVPWVGEAGWRIVKLVPFVATSDAGASTPFDVVANLALFVPFGLYLGLLAPSWPWWKAAGAVAAASLGLEVAQYVLAVGSSDLTDVVVNTAGGLAGLGLLALAQRRLGARTAAVLTRACTIGTVLAVLAGALVVASPMRFGPPEDVRCDVRRAVRAARQRRVDAGARAPALCRVGAG